MREIRPAPARRPGFGLFPLLLAAGILIGAASPARALCHIDWRPFIMGQPAVIYMTAAREPCRVSLYAGSHSRYEALRLLERPRGGRVVLDGRAGAVYTPAPGFAGPDRFVMGLTGTSSIGSGTSLITVEVEVP
ncbi:MAG: hypothetical protein JNK84_18235 [Phreatobacter sp.]|uniref:Ig-like domain-containing protein n=1 Tax=Phreatobacter sp. TaxID=1966341 RepID=UPI001A61C47D|nr:Ig-like domain-containing protein [Phreatobacter sp.]MBL8571014.1 hypothetical protein [Phreatobacter sp.]